MNQVLMVILSAGTLLAADLPLTPGQLVKEAVDNNPELRFYEKQVLGLPRATAVETPAVARPLDFPSRVAFRNAVLDIDAGLARLYLDEFRFVLGGEVRLKSMEYQAATETATVAQDLATRITSLVKMLEGRPAAGIESLIERRILEAAALPFVKQAAESSLRASLLRIELNGLLGRVPDSALTVTGSFEPLPEITAEKSKALLLLSRREAEIDRGLLGAEAASGVEAFSVGGWFTREGLGSYGTSDGLTHPGTTSGGTPAETRARLIEDARGKLAAEVARRRLAAGAALDVWKSLPPNLIENLQKASDLAERQYRVGSLDVNLLIETHREYLEALKTRNDFSIQAWRNILDLELLNLAPPNAGKITVTPEPAK